VLLTSSGGHSMSTRLDLSKVTLPVRDCGMWWRPIG
jgi:hypothetical protein